MALHLIISLMSCPRYAIPGLFIFFFTIGIYSNTLKNGFVYDDYGSIINNGGGE